jgi:hypothetical protein
VDASNYIAGGALAVAVLGYLDNRRALREDRRDRRAQIAVETEDREAKRLANVRAARGGVSWSQGSGEHEFFVIAGGPANARDVLLWFADDNGARITAAVSIPVLPAGQREQKRITGPRDQPGDTYLVASWNDDVGPHEERLMDVPSNP